MTTAERAGLRYSVVFVWLWTAAVSVWELHGQSRDLLLAGGVASADVVSAMVLSGAATDALLGAWIALRPSRMAYLLALTIMVLMTVVATLLSPSLWLHPLGPLSKNIPIAAVLVILARKRT
jgi:hypothetical protein